MKEDDTEVMEEMIWLAGVDDSVDVVLLAIALIDVCGDVMTLVSLVPVSIRLSGPVSAMATEAARTTMTAIDTGIDLANAGFARVN